VLTPSQTVGPFFAHALPWPDGPHVVGPHVVGPHVVGPHVVGPHVVGPHIAGQGSAGAFWLRGRVLDGAGDPVPDALVESWQADPDGHFDHPEDPAFASGAPGGFRGFGRCGTDAAGRWAVRTVRPGRVPARDGRPQAPHLDLSIFARGLLDRVVTRVYLPDEPAANAEDPVLAEVDPTRRGTLIAAPAADGYTFDIRLQGDHETVFFDV